MTTILSGDATPAQLIGFVVALRAKGESAEELAGLLDAVLAHAAIVPLGEDVQATPRSTSSAQAAIIPTRSTCRRWRPSSPRRRRCAGVQARAPGRLVEVRHRRRARRSSACAIELTPAGVRHCVDDGGDRLLSRAGVPSCLSVRGAVAARDRHPDRVQPARPDGEPGASSPPGDRCRQRIVRRADDRDAATHMIDPRLGRPWRRTRRVHHDRPSQVIELRDGEIRSLRGRPGRPRSRSGAQRRPRRAATGRECRGGPRGPRRRPRAAP